jgi:hypothetical protein
MKRYAQGLKFVQVYPAIHAVGPVQPVPPHCPYAVWAAAVDEGADDELDVRLALELEDVDLTEVEVVCEELEVGTALEERELVEATLLVDEAGELTVLEDAVPAVSPKKIPLPFVPT